MKARMLQVRTHASLLATLDALAERLGADPRLAHSGRFTRSDAARVAITAGLAALEAQGPDPHSHGAQRRTDAA